jgi:hypothetical protein
MHFTHQSPGLLIIAMWYVPSSLASLPAGITHLLKDWGG